MTRLKTISAGLKARYEALPRALQIGIIGLALGMVALMINATVVRLQNYRVGVRAQVEAHRETWGRDGSDPVWRSGCRQSRG